MEEKKEYLNEEKYQKTNKKVNNSGKMFLIIGIILLVAGIAITVIGFIKFGGAFTEGISSAEIEEINNAKMASNVFGSIGMMALGGFIGITGATFSTIGIYIIVFGHGREITAYTTQQVMPVAQEGIEKMAPTIGNVASEIAKGIKNGLDDKE